MAVTPLNKAVVGELGYSFSFVLVEGLASRFFFSFLMGGDPVFFFFILKVSSYVVPLATLSSTLRFCLFIALVPAAQPQELVIIFFLKKPLILLHIEDSLVFFCLFQTNPPLDSFGE